MGSLKATSLVFSFWGIPPSPFSPPFIWNLLGGPFASGDLGGGVPPLRKMGGCFFPPLFSAGIPFKGSPVCNGFGPLCGVPPIMGFAPLFFKRGAPTFWGGPPNDGGCPPQEGGVTPRGADQ